MNGAGLNRDDDEQGVAGLNRKFVSTEDDRAAAFRVYGGGRAVGVRTNRAELSARFDDISQRNRRLEDAGVRGGVVRLQVGFFGVGGLVKRLRVERRFGSTDTVEFNQEILQATVQGREVFGRHFSSSSAFGVDGGNLAVKRSTQGAARQEWSGPTPERIEAGRHGALGRVEGGAATDDVTDPGVQFERVASAVQVNVVGRVGEDLSFEKMSQATCGGAVQCARKGAGEVSRIGRVTTLSRAEGGFVEHGNEDDSAAQDGRLPRFDPLVQKRGALVFVAMRRAVNHQNRTGGRASPDPRVEAEVVGAEPMLMPARGKGVSYERRRSRRGIRHD